MRSFTKKAKLKGLIITRREGDQIVFNHGEVKIEVVEISGRWVRLCFKADKEIHIGRAEDVKKDAPQ